MSADRSNIPALYPEPYLTLIAAYRVLIFNGDHDACVPVNDNEAWTASLGLPVEAPWRPWLVDNQARAVCLSVICGVCMVFWWV